MARTYGKRNKQGRIGLMANLNALLQAMMAKASRKQIRLVAGKQKSHITGLRRGMKDVRTRVTQAERAIHVMQTMLARLGALPAVEQDNGKKPRRMTGRRVKILRGKLGLTQIEMASLVHVTPQAVYLWERRDRAPIRMREVTRAEFLKLQGIGRREAAELLKSRQPAKKAVKKATRKIRAKAAKRPVLR